MTSHRYRRATVSNPQRLNPSPQTDFNCLGRLGAFMSTMSALVWHACAPAQPLPQTLPTGAEVVSGQVQIEQTAQHMQIEQNSAQAIINWGSFSIGAQASVQVQQPNEQSVLLNRVVGDQLSQIYGSFQSNGQVMLINPNGVVMGPSGRITATAFTASTLGITDEQFLLGQRQFQNTSPVNPEIGIRIMPGAVIQTAQGGYLALISPQIAQQGQLNTQGGDALLAAADQVNISNDLSLSLSQRVSLCVSHAQLAAHIAQNETGQIQTQGGAVLIKAAQVIDAISGAPAPQISIAGQIDTRGGDVNMTLDGAGAIQLEKNSRILAGSGDIVLGSASGGQTALTLDDIDTLQARRIALWSNYGHGIRASGGKIDATQSILITNVDQGHIRMDNQLHAGQSITIHNTGKVNATDVEHQSILQGELSGSAELIKQGQGELILSGHNTYEGKTWIQDGSLQVGTGQSERQSQLGRGPIELAGNNSHLIYHTGQANEITQAIFGAGHISSTESLHFLAPVTLSATPEGNHSLTIQTQTDSQSVSAGHIFFQGNTDASPAVAITSQGQGSAQLVVESSNGIFINNAIDAATQTLHIQLTAKGQAAQPQDSRGIILAAQADVNTQGVLVLNGTTQSAQGAGVLLSSQAQVNAHGELQGAPNQTLQIQAQQIEIHGDQRHASQAQTGQGIVLDAHLQSTQGDTVLRSRESGITLTTAAQIEHSADAGAIELHAGNGSANAQATIQLHGTGAAPQHAQITQHSDRGVFLHTDGLGDITVPKINHQGRGDVVLAAGTLLEADSRLDAGSIRTLSGYQLINPNGRTKIYTSSTENTGRLAHLNDTWSHLYFSQVGADAQNAHSAFNYAKASSDRAHVSPLDVYFREKVEFNRPLTPTALTYEYASANTHQLQSEALTQAMKYQIALDECATDTQVSPSAWLSVSTAELLRTSQFEIDQAKWSQTGFLNAGTYAMNMRNDTFTLDPQTALAHQVQVTPKTVQVAQWQGLEKTYDQSQQLSLSQATASLAGVVQQQQNRDDVQIDFSSAQAQFNQAHVVRDSEGRPMAQPVSVQGVKLQGQEAANYQIAEQHQTEGVILPKPILSATIGASTQVYSNLKEPGAVSLGSDVLPNDEVFAANQASVMYNKATDLSSGGHIKVGQYHQFLLGGLTGAQAGNYTLDDIQTPQANYLIQKADLTLNIRLVLPSYGVAVGWNTALGDTVHVAHDGLSLDSVNGIDGILFHNLRLAGPDHTNYQLTAFKYPYTVVYPPADSKKPTTDGSGNAIPTTLSALNQLRPLPPVTPTPTLVRPIPTYFEPLFPTSLTHYSTASTIPRDNLHHFEIQRLIRRSPFADGIYPAQRVRFQSTDQTLWEVSDSEVSRFFIDSSESPYQVSSQ